MLREYLQCKILESVYESEYANVLFFIGGTCLRLLHGNSRFSEDLDFDNLGLDLPGFRRLVDKIKTRLEREGYAVDAKITQRGAWHCQFRFTGLLFGEGLSGYQEEKMRIQMDTEPQGYVYEPERIFLNRFEVFTTVITAPPPLLLSQKIFAVLNRPRKKGRDFFDIIFLLGKKVMPDFEYLKLKAGIVDSDMLKRKIAETCQTVDLEIMAREVEPFLFDPQDRRKVLFFKNVFMQNF